MIKRSGNTSIKTVAMMHMIAVYFRISFNNFLTLVSNMQNLARIRSIDYNILEGNLKVSYNVSVSVEKGEIEFIIIGILSGNRSSLKSEVELRKCKEVLSKKNKEYSEYVLKQALDRLKYLNPDSDYKVSVKIDAIRDELVY